MTTRNRPAVGAALIVGALAMACSGTSTDTTWSAEAEPRDALETDGEEELNAQLSMVETPSRQLFRDPNTSGPRLDVFDADGNVAVFVSGPIGTENDVIPGLGPDSSLVELYQILHPTESEVPSELAVLDERVAPRLDAVAASAVNEAPAEARVDKSQSQFNSTVCKTFTEGGSRYTPIECRWVANANIVRVAQRLNVLAGDRVYGWNNASQAAGLYFYPCDTCTPTGVVDLPAFWWTWGSMNGGGPYAANLISKDASANPGGDRGATHHRLSFIIR